MEERIELSDTVLIIILIKIIQYFWWYDLLKILEIRKTDDALHVFHVLVKGKYLTKARLNPLSEDRRPRLRAVV